MRYVPIGKSQLRERAEKFDSIHLLPSSAPEGNYLSFFRGDLVTPLIVPFFSLA